MLYKYIAAFNWVDICILVCVFRMLYIGLKQGIVTELFKLGNIIVCSFAALHFYTPLSTFIHNNIKAFPVEAAAFLSYIVLIFLITMCVRILREGFFTLNKKPELSPASKYSALCIGLLRGVLISGLIIFGMLISTIHYVELSARTSFLGTRFVVLPVKIYEGAYYGLAGKFIFNQDLNQDVVKALEGKPKEK